MSKSGKNTWLAISVFGLLTGLVMVIWPSAALSVLGIVIGIVMILFGVLQFALQWKIEPNNAFSGRYILAVLVTLAGIFLLARGAEVLLFFFGALLLIDSLHKFRLAFVMRKNGLPDWKLTMIESGLFTLVGVTLLFVPATVGKVVIVLCGLGLVINCGLNIWVALRVNKLTTGRSFPVK